MNNRNCEMECISIIVPVYKTEKYLPQCIESILKQTYENLEILLIDDGSPDRCGDICDEYAAKDSRIKVIHQPNKGVSAARNAGLDCATGTYVGFVDADDWIEPDMYEKLHDWMKNEDVRIIGCGWITYFQGIERWFESVYSKPIRLKGEALISQLLLRGYFKGVLWNKLIDRRLIDEYSIRLDEDLFYNEDELFLLRCAIASGEAYYLPKPFYHYRVHNASAVHTFSEKHLTRIESRQRMIELVESYGSIISNLAKAQYSAVAAETRAFALLSGDQKAASILLPHAKRYATLCLVRSKLSLWNRTRFLLKLLCPRLSLTIWYQIKGVWQRVVWKKN